MELRKQTRTLVKMDSRFTTTTPCSHLVWDFIIQLPLKALHNIAGHPHIHTATTESTLKGDGQFVGSLDTQLGGGGDRTGNLPGTGQAALPPEPPASPGDTRQRAVACCRRLATEGGVPGVNGGYLRSCAW